MVGPDYAGRRKVDTGIQPPGQVASPGASSGWMAPERSAIGVTAADVPESRPARTATTTARIDSAI